MEEKAMVWTIETLAGKIGGEVYGDGSLRIDRPVPSHSRDPHGIAFAENVNRVQEAWEAGVGALIAAPEFAEAGRVMILHSEPRRAFGVVLALFKRPLASSPGIHPTAVVHETAMVAVGASVGPFCVVGPEAVIEEGAVLHARCFVGDRSCVGASSLLYPGVTLYQDVLVGSDCIIHSGAVLGSDGFGYAWNGQEHVKIPQVGRVVVGNKVEIGAGTCIDRSTCGDTVIGDGTKLDNLVQIAHNCRLGRHVVLASQVGIAGSCTLGDGVVIGGQAGLKDHVNLAAGVQLGAQSGVMSDLEPGAYFGSPAIPMRESLRVTAAGRQVPDLIKRLRQLEAEVARLAGSQKDPS